MTHSSLPQLGLLHRDRLEKAVRLLRQPGSIAAIASLGIHGALAAGLPLLPAAQPPKPEQQTVRLVQLSPMEMLRLPQPEAGLTLPNSQNSTPLATAPYKLPQSNDAIVDTPLGGETIEVPGTPSDGTSYLDEEYLKQLEAAIARTKAQQTAQPSPSPSPSPSASASPGASGSPSPSPSPSPSTAPQSPAPGAPPGTSTAQQPQRLSSAQENLRALQRKRAARSNASAGSPTGSGDASGALSQLIAEIDRIATANGSELGLPPPQALAVPCPASPACTQVAQALTALPAISVAVDPQGKVIQRQDDQGNSSPLILQVKTGDAAIDTAVQKALTAITSKFAATGKYQIYQFRIQFQTDSEASQG